MPNIKEYPNVFRTWRRFKTQDGSAFSSALKELGEAFGTEYTHSRYCEWEAGTRNPQSEVFNYILAETLSYYLSESGLDQKLIKKIIVNCTLNK